MTNKKLLSSNFAQKYFFIDILLNSIQVFFSNIIFLQKLHFSSFFCWKYAHEKQRNKKKGTKNKYILVWIFTSLLLFVFLIIKHIYIIIILKKE